MLTISEKITETVLLTTLNIGLPTVDTYSDLWLITKCLILEKNSWALLLLAPFLLNYILTWALWWRVDKRKHISWVAAALGCYPQLRAANVIRLIWGEDPEKGMKKKRKLERIVSELEVFAESVFTVFVSTYIAFDTRNPYESKTILGNPIGFSVQYSTSILAASLGLAKILKVGPCRVLAKRGPLGGYCTAKFFILMASAGCTFVSKGWMLILTLTLPTDSTSHKVRTVVMICTIFLPGLVTAIMSMCHYKDVFKNMISHPSLLLMPIFTYFTFSSTKKCCCKKEEDTFIENTITFSTRWTLANFGVSILGHIVFGVLISLIDHCPYSSVTGFLCAFFYVIIKYSYLKICLPLAIAGVLLTVIFLFIDRCCSCSPETQLAVLKINDPLVEYVVDKDTFTGVKNIITTEDWEKLLSSWWTRTPTESRTPAPHMIGDRRSLESNIRIHLE